MQSINRIKSSLCESLVGFLLIFVVIFGLSYNENRSVNTAQFLADTEASTVTIPAAALNDPAALAPYIGKNIHVMIEVQGAPLRDPVFGVQHPNALRLRRGVEMLQWVERERALSDEEKKDRVEGRGSYGALVQDGKQYSYVQEWVSEPVASGRFMFPHMASPPNPPQMPFSAFSDVPPEAAKPDDVPSGARASDVLAVSSEIGRAVATERPLPVTSIHDVTLPPLPSIHHTFALTGHNGGALLLRAPSSYAAYAEAPPHVGDVRVWFSAAPGGATATVLGSLARRAGGVLTLTGHDGSAERWGEPFLHVELGSAPVSAAFRSLHSSNWWKTWALRVGGWLALLVAFSLLFSPLHAVAEALPLVGPLLSALLGLGTGVVSFALATGVAAVTIAVAWFAVRPALALALLAVAAAAFFVPACFAKSSSARAAATAGAATAAAGAAAAGSDVGQEQGQPLLARGPSAAASASAGNKRD